MCQVLMKDLDNHAIERSVHFTGHSTAVTEHKGFLTTLCK